MSHGKKTCQNCGKPATTVLTDGRSKWSSCDTCRRLVWTHSDVARHVDPEHASCEACSRPATWAADTGAGGVRYACNVHHAEAVKLARRPPAGAEPIPEDWWARVNPRGWTIVSRDAAGTPMGWRDESTDAVMHARRDGKFVVSSEGRTSPPLATRDDAIRYIERRGGCRTCGGPMTGQDVDGAYCVSCATGVPTRRNPSLILVHGLANPSAPAAVKRAWCTFHEKDAFDGEIQDIGNIPGTPDYTFALGRCVDIDLGRGSQDFSPRPWLVYAPGDKSLWIVSERPIKLGSGLAGAPVRSITYDPMAVPTGKDPAKYRHKFESPRPTFCPLGNLNYCRAMLLEGGVYRVDDWIRD